MVDDAQNAERPFSGGQVRERLGRFLVDRAEGRGTARAQCAALARGAGTRFGDDVRATRSFLELLPVRPDDSGEFPDIRESPRFDAALNDAFFLFTLFALVRPDRLSERGRSFPEAALVSQHANKDDDWMSRNFERLLGLRREEIDPHVIRIARRMGRDSLSSVDVARLFDDLSKWDMYSGGVRRDWSYRFWAKPENSFNESKNDSEESKT